jgi:AcrR family transcriptional regulator
MSQPVKETRRYESPRRRAQAEATRREILEAAERLFAEQGYGVTTMAAIAKEANVALKTVYLAFETKSGLLRALWNLRLRGDAGDVPVGGREWYREVLDEPDPARALQLNARNSRAVKERFGRLHPVVRGAASVDPEVDAMLQRIHTEFYENQRTVVESLAKKKALRKGLDVARATDILWTLNHPDTWHHLVFDRGWTPEQYEEWFAAAAARELLA